MVTTFCIASSDSLYLKNYRLMEKLFISSVGNPGSFKCWNLAPKPVLHSKMCCFHTYVLDLKICCFLTHPVICVCCFSKMCCFHTYVLDSKICCFLNHSVICVCCISKICCFRIYIISLLSRSPHLYLLVNKVSQPS